MRLSRARTDRRSGTPAQAFLDDRAAGASYTGDFTGVGMGGNAAVGVTSEDSDGTLSWTGTAGAAASVAFQGTYVQFTARN